jgi:hypothetical protein
VLSVAVHVESKMMQVLRVPVPRGIVTPFPVAENVTVPVGVTMRSSGPTVATIDKGAPSVNVVAGVVATVVVVGRIPADAGPAPRAMIAVEAAIALAASTKVRRRTKPAFPINMDCSFPPNRG